MTTEAVTPKTWKLVDDRPVHIVASPFKTGTSSLGRALIELGVARRDMGYRRNLLLRLKPIKQVVNEELDLAPDPRAWLWANAARLRTEMSFLIEAAAGCDVFSDAPLGHTHLHPAIRKVLFPGARFIWVDREFDDWIESVRNWEITHPDTYTNWRVWERNPGKRIDRLRENRERHYRRFRIAADLFPEDFLEVPMRALSYAPLCEFYGVPDPGKAFPQLNVSAKDAV